MDKKEALRKKIDKYGLEQVGKILHMSTTKLVRYCDYPVDNIEIIYELLLDLYDDLHNRPGGYFAYKEFSIHYDRFEGLLIWNNGGYVENNGGGVSFEFYATPFYNAEPMVPITLSSIWIDNIDGGEAMEISDEIDDEYYDSYRVDYKQLNSVDKLIEWFHNIYLPRTYYKIYDMMSEIIKNNNLEG
jgi:hypothetical protein